MHHSAGKYIATDRGHVLYCRFVKTAKRSAVDFLILVVIILLPFIGVLLDGIHKNRKLRTLLAQTAICFLLTLLGYIPGIIYGIWLWTKQ
jgi:uncharacterized membrane protein YqaE (UPF0057 family)